MEDRDISIHTVGGKTLTFTLNEEEYRNFDSFLYGHNSMYGYNSMYEYTNGRIKIFIDRDSVDYIEIC